MARPRVHLHERRTTGLRLSAPVHDALRDYNQETGVPMTKVIEVALEQYLIELGYYDPDNVPAPKASNGNGAKKATPAKKPTAKRAVVAKRGK